MKKIRLAVVGVGNCASSLIQGIEFYRRRFNGAGRTEALGLMNYAIGGYRPQDIEVVCAFDIDKRKVGLPVKKAIFRDPNCTQLITNHLPSPNAVVQMGEILDGISEHMADYPDNRRFMAGSAMPVNVAKTLKDSGAEVCVNYLPVGSTKATEFYANACLEAGVSFLNCMPVFIASNPVWAKRFAEGGIPIIGDDIKSQVGATIVHRTLARLFEDRGVRIDRTYQLNTGGNTDFLNMLNRARLKHKKISKTESVQSQLAVRLDSENIHIGPSDYVPWQNDNKVAFIRIEGRGFANVPLNIEVRLSVEDSPNSAGVAVDAIRCLKIARERKIKGPLYSASAYLMKHPPVQHSDTQAKNLIQDFIKGKRKD
ncbi:MAG: inositol-3-phosphate synthase [Omnitrophica bacterium RIFCSPHIGHO2_02_FULL_63_14]|nr:MAG: inositol-3-phosphate synthase [Omnitrophica bacterium RIFCSPHIGHO2_02_FULL_63_14]